MLHHRTIAEDFKYKPSLRNKVNQLWLAVEQEGKEVLAIVDLDQWYALTLTQVYTLAHIESVFHCIKSISLNTVQM